ncbi:MAG: flagellar assembly protein FliH [Desulforhopalus sp.]|nr:flagellar assembly protein FliH [Desulforhopalus sp.]
MSLSRYFKNAPDFQAEKIVKQGESITPSGWSPDPRKSARPFQYQETQTRPLAQPEKQFKLNDIPEPPAEKVAPEIDTSLPPAAEPQIDLSQYIPLTVAEGKITEAYRNGAKAVWDKAEQDYGAATRSLLNTCQQLDTLRATIMKNSSQELLDLSMAIAEKILRISLREQDQSLIATIEEALRRAVKSDEFTIHVHPDDYDTIVAKSPELVAGLSGLNNIVVRKDNSIERGGARIESDNCTIDATISSQLEQIREEVKRHS